MAVNNGVTCDRVLPSVSSLTRAGFISFLSPNFRKKFHLKALCESLRLFRLRASLFHSCSFGGRSEDAIFGQFGPFGQQGLPLSSFLANVKGGLCARLVGTCIIAYSVCGGVVKAEGGGDVTLEVISAWGGPVNTIDVQGNLAYIGSGRRMVILDITDFENITEVGSIDLLSTVEDIAVRDGFAYVATKQEIFGYGFCSVNVSDPNNPTLASNPDAFGNFQPRLVELYQNFAFAQRTSGSIDEPSVFDITDPENVIWLGKEFLPGANTIVIAGSFLYMANDEDLRIYDLSTDPLNPMLVGVGNTGFQVEDVSSIAVEGSLVCAIADIPDSGDDVLAVFDVSNPRMPFLAGTYNFNTFASNHHNGLDVSGGLAYVASGTDDGAGGLLVIDVTSDPANPALIGAFDTHATIYGVKVFGTTAYLFDAGEGLIALDVSNPAKPVRLGGYHSPAYLRKMKKIGDLLYVSDTWNGFTVLDVSDPHSTPTVVGIYQTPVSSPGIALGNWGLDVRDGMAYLAEGLNGIEVVDVSNPANAVSAGAVNGVTAMDLKLNPTAIPPFTDILHVGTRPGAWLVNFDVSNPSNITEIGSAFLGGGDARVYDIEVTPDGQYAHVARSLALQVVDVSVPKAPDVIYTGGPDDVLEIALDGNIRYLANSDDSGCDDIGAMHVQDIFDPASPSDLVIVDWCYSDLGIRRVSAVTVSNDRTYVVANFSPPDTGAIHDFVVVFDVTDPSAPVLLDYIKAGHEWKSSLLIDDPYLYVTTYKGSITSEGLVIIEVVESTTTTPDDFNAFRGFLDSGTFADVLASDDMDLCHDLGITIFPSEAPITLDFDGTLPNDSPASLDVTFESSANTPGLELTISMWNYNTNSWDIVGTASQGFNVDVVRTFPAVPADHVEAGTGAVRTRYEVRQMGIIFQFPWTDCVDHVFWTTVN